MDEGEREKAAGTEEELVERLTDEESDRYIVEEDVKDTLNQFRELGLVDENG